MIKHRTIISSLARLNFKQIWNQVPFIILVGCGLALFSALTILSKGTYKDDILPATYHILDTIRGFEIGILLILALYTSEIFWKEKTFNVHHITDSLPIATGVKLMGQVLGMTMIHCSLLLLLMLNGIIIQLATGFYALNIGLYVSTLFTEFLINGLLIILLSVFLNTLINQKLVSNAVIVLVITSINYFPAWGLEHKLWHFARLNLGMYSDLNGYQTYQLNAFYHYTIYWLGFGILLFQLSKLIYVRGTDTYWRQRVLTVKKRFNKSFVYPISLSFIVILSSGLSIYTNTTRLNTFQSRKDLERFKVAYEKELKPLESIETPEIIDLKLKIDLFSSKRSYRAEGTYTMINSSEQPIPSIHLLANPNPKISLHGVEFNKEFQLPESFPEFKYNIYTLNVPLQPGDTIKMNFEMSYVSKGFAQNESFSVVHGGSFLTNMHLPKLSYDPNFELESSISRSKYGLTPKTSSKAIGDPKGYRLGTSYAKNIAFDVTLSTDSDQEAATSGYLVKQWSEENRNYFNYKSESPIENQFAVLSGKFKNWNEELIINEDTISLRIGHHKSHNYNISDMMRAMKATITYNTTHISPYQYKTLNLFEIPRYHDFAMSIPNTIAFSEGMGFMLDKSEDFNIPFYITAHEVAHQWWGDQVRGALVKGSEVIEETLAQYIAAVVYIDTYGVDKLKHIMDFEKRRYMVGRKRETKVENPLLTAENQSYVHYGKGLINMMAIRHYISEDSVNNALKNMIRKYPANLGIYADVNHLITELRAVTPDSLQYLITDMFEEIVFYENSIQKANIKNSDSTHYEVSLEVDSKKFNANAEGILMPVQFNDWVEVGVYTIDKNGKEVLGYRKMYRLKAGNNEIIIPLKDRPTKAVIDPDNLLMDRNADDNIWKF